MSKKLTEAMFKAVREGDDSTVYRLIEKYGLSYSPKWDEGYALLIAALKSNQLEVAKVLVTEGAKVCCGNVSRGSKTPLYYAVKSQDFELCALILRKNPEDKSEKYDWDKDGFLFYAVEIGDKKLTSFSLEKHGSGVHIRDQWEATPLHSAVEYDKGEIVELLMARGANVDAEDIYGRTPLYCAVEIQSNFMVRLLLHYKPSLSNRGNQRAVRLAVKGLFYLAVSRFADYGFNILPEDPGNSLHSAICDGNVEKVVKTLEEFSNVEQTTNSTKSDDLVAKYMQVGLFFAMSHSKFDIAQVFVCYGANFVGKDCFGETLIEWALDFEDIAMLDLLLKNCETEIPLKCLFRAAKYDWGDFADCLLFYGANPNVSKKKSGNTPLHIAARKGHVKVAKLLLKHGADVNAVNRRKQTALHFAVFMKKIKMVRLLLENRADVDVIDCERFTPLHVACDINDPSFASSLLAFGANLEKKKFYGCGMETPLHMACRDGHEDTIRFLVNYGADINYLYDDQMTPAQSAFPRGSWRDDPDKLCPDAAIEFLLHQVVKLHSAGLFVCEENLETLNDGLIDDFMTTDIRRDCEKEVSTMKDDKIADCDVSVYDILTSSNDGLAKLVNRDSLRCILGDLKKKYLLYGEMLSWKIKIALKKLELREICFEFLGRVFPEMPYICSEQIANYLTDNDLLILLCVSRRRNIYFEM